MPIEHAASPARRANGLLPMAAGAIAGSVTTLLLLAGIGTAYAVGPAGSLQALTIRIEKLESRVAAGEDEDDRPGAGKAGATRVRAPFVVVDANDRPIVTIEGNANADFLRMGAPGAGSMIQLQRTKDQAVVLAQMGGSDEARLGVKGSVGPRLEVYTAQTSTIVGSGPNDRQGVFLRDGGGGKGQAPAKVLGELATDAGKTGGILRLHDREGKPVLSAGSNAKAGGRGQLGLGAPGKDPGVVLLANGDGHGELQIQGDGNGKPVIELSGSKRHVLLSNRSGNPAAVMRLSQGGAGSGGNFTAVDGAGNNVVSLGAKSGGGGALCAIHPKRGNQCFP